MILQPGNSFTIVRQIGNHLDTDTNYVRAVIRNAYTDAVIDTLDLTDKGSQRFKKDWQVPQDTSGQGFYISVITSVYTDSGYTTKNPNYADEENTYLVQNRVPLGRSGGGGVDSYTVRQIIKQEIEKTIQPLDSLYGAIGALQREVNRIPKELAADRADEVIGAVKAIPESPKVDLAPVISAVKETIRAVETKEITPPTDLSPLIEQVRGATEKLANIFLSREEAIASTVVETIRKDVLTQLQDIINNTTFNLQPTTATISPPKADVPMPGAVPFDITKLSA